MKQFKLILNLIYLIQIKQSISFLSLPFRILIHVSLEELKYSFLRFDKTSISHIMLKLSLESLKFVCPLLSCEARRDVSRQKKVTKMSV